MGDTLAFRSNRSSTGDINLRASDGSGGAQLLLSGPDLKVPFDWSQDGNYLLYFMAGKPSGLWYIPMNGDRKPVQFHEASSFVEITPVLSPNGRYVAYVSEEQGQREVFVTRFPSGDGKWLVSVNGGWLPSWSPRSIEGVNTLMAASVKMTPSFQVGKPQQFIVVQQDDQEVLSTITVVENWIREFESQE